MEKEIRSSIGEVLLTDGTISGLGITYGTLSENFMPNVRGGLFETISEGAASGLLDDKEIMILFNHDENLVLARNGVTASLKETENGVEYSFAIPNTSVGKDLEENLKLRNIRRSSFSFLPDKYEIVKRETEHGMINVRIIHKFKRFFDFGPVTFAAYKETTAMARAFKAVNIDESYLLRRKLELFKLKQN